VLWTANLDGAEKRALTFPPLRAFLPRWSPDGKQIAFMGYTKAGHWKVMLISVSGGTAEELTSGTAEETDPNWMPDGKSLVFGEMQDLRRGATQIGIFDLSTRQFTALPGSNGLHGPRLSPDGRYVVANTRDSKKVRIFAFATKQWRDLADVTVNFPAWSSDSEYLYFDTFTGPDVFYCRMSINNGEVKRLVELKGIRRAFGPFGYWSGLTPDGSALLVRDTGTQEVYALDFEAP
jgi:TolB protein